MSYRKMAPVSFKEITSDKVVEFFESDEATSEDVSWFKNILTSADYKTKNTTISPYNWHKIKKEFAKKYFPEIAPQESVKKETMETRLSKFL